MRAVDREISLNAGASFYGRNTPRHRPGWWWTRIAGSSWAPPSSGFEIADFLHAATIAVVGEVPMDTLWHAMPSFPTRSEVWLNLFEEYGY